MIIAVIGCGVMGSALARFFSKHHSLILCDQEREKAEALAQETGGKWYERVNDAIQDSDIVVLAVKAKDLASVSKQTGAAFSDGQLLISVLAGTSVSLLKTHFPIARVERIMPNLAVIHGKGVIGIVESDHTQNEKKWMEKLLDGLGHFYWVPENRVEALTSLTSSSPAFICLLIEAMIESGVYMGFSPKESKCLMLKTLEGTLTLLKESGKHPSLVREELSSPGGTAIAGLKVMEERAVRGAIFNAFLAAYEKARSMLTEK